MSELTADDLKRAYDKMEAGDAKNEKKTDQLRMEMNTHIATVNKHLTDLSTSTAVMAERFRQMTEKVDELPQGIPKLPERPCTHFIEHKKEHKEAKGRWVGPLITGVIVTVFLFVHEPIKAWLSSLFSKGGP